MSSFFLFPKFKMRTWTFSSFPIQVPRKVQELFSWEFWELSRNDGYYGTSYFLQKMFILSIITTFQIFNFFRNYAGPFWMWEKWLFGVRQRIYYWSCKWSRAILLLIECLIVKRSNSIPIKLMFPTYFVPLKSFLKRSFKNHHFKIRRFFFEI